jgi:GTP-dependent phosphoenolpyruvate carboxykinase
MLRFRLASYLVRSSSTYNGGCIFVSKMIEEVQKLSSPKNVRICSGSEQEAQELIEVSK